ncbi:MAG: divalent-cation tolerance protein CutA [Bauldia sp.]
MAKVSSKADPATVLVYTTWPDTASAASAGRALVEAGLAACVNILPGMASIYRWKGAVETANETVMIVKTLATRADAVTVAVARHHPYETPAIVVIPISGGSQPYLDWIGAESAGQGAGDAG